MNYRRYQRTVTVFSEQSRKFTLPDKEAGGNLKIETGNNRGAVWCSLVNLQPYARGEYVYKLILFGMRNERTIHAIVGTVPITRSGNGNAYFRFNPLDVNGQGDEYGYFTTAIVAAVSMNNGREPLHPVLKGELGNEPAEQNPELKTKPGPAQAEPDSKAQSVESKADPNPAQTKPGSVQAQQLQPRTFNHFYNEYLLHFCAQVCQMADYYEEVWPFEQDKTGARWKKILNVGHFPLISPGAHYFSQLYHHYLFGARPDGKGYASCYFLAVPGKQSKTEQPDGGHSGFCYWQQAKGRSDGYWIVEIDGQSGDIHEVSIEKAKEV